MRAIALAVLVLFSGLSGAAQTSVNLGLSYGSRLNHRAISVGSSTPTLNRVSGAGVEFTTPAFAGLDARFTAGIEGTYTPIQTPTDNLPNRWGDYVVIPIRAGLQHYFLENKAFLFAEPGIGIGYFPEEKLGHARTRANLSYAFGGGYRFHFRENKYLQASLSFNRNHYDRERKFSWINLRAAFGIEWGGEE